MAQATDNITIYTDGGSRGNPGPAAAGFVITDSSGATLDARGVFLGHGTNNFAEYSAVIKSLELARKYNPSEVTVISDSELLVRQIKGQYKVKSPNIRPLYEQVMDLLSGFDKWNVYHVTRDKNTQADSLVNQALDTGRDVVKKSQKPRTKQKPIRLAVLISGGGTTLMNILDYIKDGRLNAEVALVICSRSKISGVEKAKKAGLEVKIIRKKDHPDIDDFSRQMEQALTEAGVDLVVQGGWLCLWKIPDKYENKVMNIHPALLPSFGGRGMWGHHVHEAVLKAGAKVSGCTVHFCTNEYDKGPIIVQRCCQAKDTDTPDDLAARVFEQECIAYPEAIELFAQGRLHVVDGIVKID